MAALVPGLGGDKKGSIIMMREKIDILRNQPYDSLAFGSSPLVTSVTELEEELPKSIMLYQNYPNPFNPSTKIKFAIPPGLSVNHNELKVTLTVYDMLGRELVTLINEPLGAGVYEIEFDGTDLPSGVYFYRFIMGNYIQSNKMMLLK
ncbi:MAG TPA: T9SS type A sorting domain-containing protein [Ignavibacteria bacterium]|nr:T9SS type A sorting domain-containing protein [Ignavibacteria bacterium]